MANWNNTKLTCNDLQRFTEIMKTNPFSCNHTAQKYEDKAIELDKDGIAYIMSRNDLPIEDIKKISKENPDLIFTAEYSLESDNYITNNIITYKNGDETDQTLSANYGLCGFDADFKKYEYYKKIMGKYYNELYDKAIEIFRRIDVIKGNDEGKYIDFVNGISLTVENDDYQMQLTKSLSMIEKLICLKKIKETIITIVPIKYDENDLPLPGKDSLPF